MEPQDGPSLLEVLTVVFAVAVLILYGAQHVHVPATVLPHAFVGFAYFCLFLAMAVRLGLHSGPPAGRAARTDVGLLTAVTVLPISTSILMALTYRDVNFFALANAFYLLSLAFAVWVTGKEPICTGDACKMALLAQVAGFLVSAAVHSYIFKMQPYTLQTLFAFIGVSLSCFVHLVLILVFLRRSLPHAQ